jgi:hypothetical protein
MRHRPVREGALRPSDTEPTELNPTASTRRTQTVHEVRSGLVQNFPLAFLADRAKDLKLDAVLGSAGGSLNAD